MRAQLRCTDEPDTWRRKAKNHQKRQRGLSSVRGEQPRKKKRTKEKQNQRRVQTTKGRLVPCKTAKGVMDRPAGQGREAL